MENKRIKILVLSSTPWSYENSFGNSYSNIFEGMENLEFANIYCKYGQPKNKIKGKYFQITEKSLLKNLINRNSPSGVVVNKNNVGEELNKKEIEAFNYARKNRSQFLFWTRDLIWKIGNWKSKELENFIKEFDADIIFVPLYYSLYLNDIVYWLKIYTKVSMVGYISDDNYTMKQFSLSILFWINRVIERKKLKKVIDSCEYLYVISDIQKKEYETIFNKECKILTKGEDFSKQFNYKKNINRPLKIIFTGNIGDGRWKTLALLNNVLKKINKDSIKIQLFIYTLTPMTNKMKKSLSTERISFLKGGVPNSEIEKIQNSADILLHVESFSLKEKLKVRHSFSTKIVDYLQRNGMILAIGPKEVASIDYFIKNDAGLVATDEKEIEEQLDKIIKNNSLIKEYSTKAWESGKKNHQIDKIQRNLYNDIKTLVGEKNESYTNKCY